MTIFFLTPFLWVLSILECNRIVDSVYLYSWNFATLFISHLSSILALFFLKSLLKLLLHNERFSILNQVLLFYQLFHCYRYSYGQESIANWFASGHSSATIFLSPFVFDWYSIDQLWLLDFSVFSEQLDSQKKSRFLVSINPFSHRRREIEIIWSIILVSISPFFIYAEGEIWLP